MSKTMNKINLEDITTRDQDEILDINKQLNEQNKLLTNEVAEVKKAMALIMNDFKKIQECPQPLIIDSTSKMDKPCTLIHLCECSPGLPNTIFVGKIPYNFSKFGEEKTFRFAEMQDILSRYFSLFERNMFTLGDDCSELSGTYSLKALDVPMTVQQYKKIASVPIDEFLRLIKNLNINQRVRIAKMWMQRYEAGDSQYSDIDKIKILNKATKGTMMKEFIKDLVSSDDEDNE